MGALPVLDDQTREQIANEFQAKLMMYRKQNYDRPSAASVQVVVGLPASSSFSAEIARALDPCFSGELLQSKDCSVTHFAAMTSWLENPPRVNYSQLRQRLCFELATESSTAKLHLTAITKQLNGILEQQGETLTTGPARGEKHWCAAWAWNFCRATYRANTCCCSSANRERIHKMARDFRRCLIPISARAARIARTGRTN